MTEENGPESAKPRKMPVTRSLIIINRILSLAILVLGLIMMFLAIRDMNAVLALVSLIFVGIGFVKIRDLLPGVFPALRGGSAGEHAAYNNILLPVSRWEAVESMVKIGCDLVSPGGKLNIITIIEVPPQLPAEAEVKKDNARALLRAATEYAGRLGVDAVAEIVSARTATDAIISLSKKYRSDLVIMGSSQRTATEKMLFGNVADAVLQEAPCDVMVLSYTNKQHPITYDKILVPTAGYRHSQRALDVAVDIAKKDDGTITSLYVGPEADAVKGNKILEDARQRAEKRGTKSDVKFMAGNVADSIIKLAGEGNYSLIIIGATEKPRYYTALLGNVADTVVRKAPCDVLVMRTR